MKDVYEIMAEVQSISAQLTFIRTPFEDRETMQSVCLPTPETLYNAIFGIEEHLDRIVDDLAKLDMARYPTIKKAE